MSDINYSENTFKAIDIITDEKLKEVNFDKTEICTILQQDNDIKYTVSNEGGITYEVYNVDNDKTYAKGSKVYVLIPQGNYELKKIILGTFIGDNPIAVSKFNDYQWMESFEIENGVSVNPKPDPSNPSREKDRNIGNLNFTDLKAPYDSICVETRYNTGFGGTTGDFQEWIYIENRAGTSTGRFINISNVRLVMYNFLTQFKNKNNNLMFDLNGDGYVNYDDYIQALFYTFFPNTYDLSDEKIIYLHFVSNVMEELIDLDASMFMKCIEKTLSEEDGLQLKRYIYEHWNEIKDCAAGMDFKQLYPLNIGNILCNSYFGNNQILGNPYYVTKEDSYYQYFDISSYFNDLVNIENKPLITDCETIGIASTVTFYPKIYFGYKKEKKNMVKLYQLNNYLWFNMYLSDNPNKVYNYETTKEVQTLYLQSENEEDQNLCNENGDKILQAEDNTYQTNFNLIITWQKQVEDSYEINGKTRKRYKWEDFAEFSYLECDGYIYDNLNDIDNTVVRVVITKNGNENFRIISNQITVKKEGA